MARKQSGGLACPRCGWSADGFWALCLTDGCGLEFDMGLGLGPSRGLAKLRCGACLNEFEAPASKVPRLAVE